MTTSDKSLKKYYSYRYRLKKPLLFLVNVIRRFNKDTCSILITANGQKCWREFQNMTIFAISAVIFTLKNLMKGFDIIFHGT